MLRDKKGFLLSKLNSCLAFAWCLIMRSPQALAETVLFPAGVKK